MTGLEDLLRATLTEDATTSPPPDPMVARVRHIARRRERITLMGWSAGIAATVLGVAVISATVLGDDEPPDRAAVPASPAPSSPAPSGALPEAQASCVMEYSPKAVADLAFAFDGTPVAVGPGRTDRPGMGALGLPAVTFEVHEWFAGGTGSTVTIDMAGPGAASGYDLGTRLLVSGAHRWGEKTDADLIGWGCGFTRYYDPETASAWRDATR